MKNEKCLQQIGPRFDVSQKENSLRTPSFQTEWLDQFWWFLWKYQCMTLYVSIKIIVKRVDSCFASFIFRMSDDWICYDCFSWYFHKCFKYFAEYFDEYSNEYVKNSWLMFSRLSNWLAQSFSFHDGRIFRWTFWQIFWWIFWWIFW